VRETIIFECVGRERCIDGKKLWLTYDKPENRKFAPQNNYDEPMLISRINEEDSSTTIVIKDDYKDWFKGFFKGGSVHILLNKDKINNLMNENSGICINCGEIKHGGVEPDAVKYKCEMCGENKVVGIETGLLYEWIIESSSRTPILDEYKK
jgi:hypothetical protein